MWASQDEWRTIFTIQVKGGGTSRVCVGPPGLFSCLFGPDNCLICCSGVQFDTNSSAITSLIERPSSTYFLQLPARCKQTYNCLFLPRMYIMYCCDPCLRLLALPMMYWFRLLRSRMFVFNVNSSFRRQRCLLRSNRLVCNRFSFPFVASKPEVFEKKRHM